MSNMTRWLGEPSYIPPTARITFVGGSLEGPHAWFRPVEELIGPPSEHPTQIVFVPYAVLARFGKAFVQALRAMRVDELHVGDTHPVSSHDPKPMLAIRDMLKDLTLEGTEVTLTYCDDPTRGGWMPGYLQTEETLLDPIYEDTPGFRDVYGMCLQGTPAWMLAWEIEKRRLGLFGSGRIELRFERMHMDDATHARQLTGLEALSLLWRMSFGPVCAIEPTHLFGSRLLYPGSVWESVRLGT